MSGVVRFTPEERFWSKVDKNGPIPAYAPHLGPCWVWMGSRSQPGYGTLKIGGRNGKPRLAHRLAYEWLVGPIPEGLVIDHLCRVRACVNPAHMEPVTTLVNSRRGVSFMGSKTHCPRGHEYAGQNLSLSRTGKRECRECMRRRSREFRARKRVMLAAGQAPAVRRAA